MAITRSVNLFGIVLFSSSSSLELAGLCFINLLIFYSRTSQPKPSFSSDTQILLACVP